VPSVLDELPARAVGRARAAAAGRCSVTGRCARCGQLVGDSPCIRPACVAAKERARARLRELRRLADELEADAASLGEHIGPADERGDE
jgi:hypothetical protein